MIKNITLGRFFPKNSVVHKLDPRIKIILMFFLLVAAFLSANYISIAVNLVSVGIFILLTKIPVKMYFKSMKFILLVVLFTSILNVFYAKGTPLFRVGFISITCEGLNNSIFVALRLVMLILISSLLTFTTSPTDLTDAIEHLLKPLTVFKVKTHEFAMMMTIALRFIPTLLEETSKIVDAQKARGADMESGSIFNRIKAFVPVLVPLFVSSFRRAYDLAMAMECRCYRGGEGRTRMKILRIELKDILAVIVVLCEIMLVLLCNKFFPAVIL